MCKNIKKGSFDRRIIKILQERHGYTANYIRMSINGDRVGTKPIQMADEYKKLLRAKNAAEKEALKKLDNN